MTENAMKMMTTTTRDDYNIDCQLSMIDIKDNKTAKTKTTTTKATKKKTTTKTKLDQ